MLKNQPENIEPTEEPTAEPVQSETESVEPEAVEAPEGTSKIEETPDEDDKNPNKEAAKYRKRLREAEAERDTLAAKVTAYQKKEVEQYASRLQKPSAIWAAGIELQDLLDNDGNVDVGKAQQAVAQAAAELGLVQRMQPHPAQMMGDQIPGLGPDDRMARLIQGRNDYQD